MYWQIYWTEFGGEPDGLPSCEWWSGSARFHKQVGPGDSLWVVVSGQGLGRPGEWRLLQRIVVKKLMPVEDATFPYGVQGDPKKSRKYKLKDQPDFSLVMRRLTFRSGKRLTAKGALIGRALQAIRPLSDADVAILEAYARGLAAP